MHESPPFSDPLATEAPASQSPLTGSTSAPPGQATPTRTPDLASTPAAAFPAAPERDLRQLAAELSPGGQPHPENSATPQPATYTQGQQDTFWLVDLRALEVYQSRFELRLITPHAHWYIEEGLNLSQRDIERSAAVFEESIYPKITAVFGKGWAPSIDNDPHLNILNARLRGAGGYYSSSDQHPQSVYPFSNQRAIIYINVGASPMDTSGYLEVLAHELQHAIHWNSDPSEDTWVNEGLSELAAALAGYHPRSVQRFLDAGPTSLVHWPLGSSGTLANYGAASLFMHYLTEHYGDRNHLRSLVGRPEDSIDGINAYLESLGRQETFRDVFGDWAVANVLDEAQGTYGYNNLDVQASIHKTINRFSQVRSEVLQYSVEYTELASLTGPVRLRFQGTPEVPLLPVDVGATGCWWSNSGDSINSTLTRRVDLRGLQRATLSYRVWYNIERNWDYVYLQVSTDGGRRWDILETPHTSPENPVGNSFGPGYTGNSQGWINELVDLSPYAGQEILLRFQYVTDDAINGAGLCLQEISLAEAGVSGQDGGWQADGFIRTNNRVQQDYIVQVIEAGAENRVTLVPLDAARSGEVVIETPQQADRLVVAVAPLAPKTLQPAPYTLTVERVD